jgi:hypothetical protein
MRLLAPRALAVVAIASLSACGTDFEGGVVVSYTGGLFRLVPDL